MGETLIAHPAETVDELAMPELRYYRRVIPKLDGSVETPTALQQCWLCTARKDGKALRIWHEWRDVPVVDGDSSDE